MSDFSLTPVTFDQCLHCPRAAVQIRSAVVPTDKQLRDTKVFADHCVFAANWRWCLTTRLLTRVIPMSDGREESGLTTPGK